MTVVGPTVLRMSERACEATVGIERYMAVASRESMNRGVVGWAPAGIPLSFEAGGLNGCLVVGIKVGDT